jgi:hypothetical protein
MLNIFYLSQVSRWGDFFGQDHAETKSIINGTQINV